MQYALMRVGLAPRQTKEGKSGPSPSSVQNDKEATADAVIHAVDAIAKENESAKSSNEDAVIDPTTAEVNVGSQHMPPPPPPALLKRSLKRSESEMFAMKGNKIGGNHGLPPLPLTMKRTVSLPTRDDLMLKSPVLRKFVMEDPSSKVKPKPPTTTPPISKPEEVSADKSSLQEGDIPHHRPPKVDDPVPTSQVSFIDPLPSVPPTTKTIMPHMVQPLKSKSSSVALKGPHQLPCAFKGFAQSMSPPPDSYAQLPPTIPKSAALINSHPPKAPTNGMSMPPKDNSHGPSIPPPPKINHQSPKAIDPPFSGHLPPRALHNQLPPKGLNQMPLPPKNNTFSPRGGGPFNQMPLPPRGDNVLPTGNQKPPPPKANGHFPHPPKYNNNSHYPPSHKSIHQLPVPPSKGKSGVSNPSPYSRPTSTDRMSPIDYVSNDFTRSDFDDYTSTSGRDLSRHPYRKNSTYNDSWTECLQGVYNDSSQREYQGESSYDPYYYPTEVANYAAEYNSSSREYAEYANHGGYLDDGGIHYYDDGRLNNDPTASRYYVSDVDVRRYQDYDYDRGVSRGDYNADNHSFTPTYRSRSPVPINTMYNVGTGTGSSYVPNIDSFHASSTSTPSGAKGHHNGVVKYDKNKTNNSNNNSYHASIPPHKAKHTSPLNQAAPPPLPPRRRIELSPTSANALKTPR